MKQKSYSLQKFEYPLYITTIVLYFLHPGIFTKFMEEEKQILHFV